MDMQEVYDKIEIGELFARYARGVDSRDWELWKAVFTADAVLDYSSAGIPVGSRDDIAAMFEAAFETIPMAMHYISNIEVNLDGDRATARAMFYNPMQLPGMDEQSYCGGYYTHQLVRTPEGWKSEHLVEENVWFANQPTAAELP